MSFGIRPWILSVMAMPLMMLVGCVSITPLPETTGTPLPPNRPIASAETPSPLPSVVSSQPSPSAGVLLRQDFSNGGPWSRFVGDFGSARVVDGAYRMRAGPDGGYVYGTPDSAPFFDDATVEVTVTLVEASDAAYAAIACRGVDDFVWYELGVSTDGVAFIGHVRGERYEDLAVGSTDPLGEGDSVRLEATCRGSREVGLSLAVDGETVVETTDSDGLSLGFVGLVTSGDGTATFDFDDVVIRRP